MSKRKKTAIRIAAAILALVLLSALGVRLYAADYYHADETAAAALVSNGAVTVELLEGAAIFRPEAPAAGFIFYPGGKVEFTAYAPLLSALAENGILCVLPEMPLNLAVLNVNAADGVQAQFPEVKNWYIGGHSLGGSMAASYAAQNAESFSGLILLASYSTSDLTESGLKVLSVYGSEDGVLSMEKYREYFSMLPEDTMETVILGGIHAFFGSYGVQEGDGDAGISAQEQLRLTAEAVTEFILK